jgi:hypothetical protein
MIRFGISRSSLLLLTGGVVTGVILGFIFSAVNGWNRVGRLLGLGLGFGAFIGIICAVLNYLLRTRQLGRWKIIAFPVFGALAGACVFGLFSEGLAMAVYLGIEGAILGLVIGFGISMTLLIFGGRRQSSVMSQKFE